MKMLGVMLAVIVAGCAGSAPQYYSLQADQPFKADAAAKVDSRYAIGVEPVVIPQEVARPQIVVRAELGAEVVPLNAALWAGPLEAQIRLALSDELVRRLNVLDVAQAGAVAGLPVWRIYVDVKRFDSLYGMGVHQEMVWRLVPQGMPARVKERVCSAQIHLPVAIGMSALVEGHRQALAELAAVMAQTISPPGNGAANTSPDMAGSSSVNFRGCVG